MTEPFFTIGTTTTAIFDRDSEAADSFRDQRSIVCHEALDAALLARLNGICDRATFAPEPVEGLGHRHLEQPPVAGGALGLFLKRADLLGWLERVTGRGPIRTVEGGVVETHCKPGDELAWHDDLNNDSRLLALTIALGDTAFEGGGFELRRKGSEALLRAYTPDTPGTALIFDVARDIEHRVLPVTAGGPRRVFTGWFLA